MKLRPQTARGSAGGLARPRRWGGVADPPGGVEDTAPDALRQRAGRGRAAAGLDVLIDELEVNDLDVLGVQGGRRGSAAGY